MKEKQTCDYRNNGRYLDYNKWDLAVLISHNYGRQNCIYSTQNQQRGIEQA